MASTTIAQGLRDLLSESTTLRTMIGAADAAAALLLIHVDLYEDPVLPFAVIRCGEETGTTTNSEGGWASSGDAEVEISIAVPGAYANDLEGGVLAHRVNCDAVCEEVARASHSGGRRLHIRGAGLQSVQAADIEETTKYLRGNLTFQCGMT